MRKKVKFFAAAMTALLIVFQSFSFASVPGDINNDGKIGLEDIIYGLKIMVKIDVPPPSTTTTSNPTSSTTTTTLSTVTTTTTGGTTTTTISTAGDTGDRTDYTSVTLTAGGAYSAATSGVQKQNVQYTSATPDTPAVKVSSGGSLELTNCKVDKSGATADREKSGFFGFNSGVLASSSGQVNSYSGTGTAAVISMTDCTITTSASGANGAFAFGEDAVATLDHVTIVTTGSDNSRGVDATYGGTVNISNSTISTQGGSCAALATDRYDRYEAPKINATNCVGTTAGTGSPGIYCTGTFTVSDSTLTATGSEAAVIEGFNSITLTDTNISGAKKWGVMIYQSMSGDSSVGTGTFTMTGGALTNNSTGPLFFVCNTTAVIELTGAALTNSSDTLLWATTAAAGSAVDSNVNKDWGTKGGTVTFTATNQTLKGNIKLQESSSSIELELINSNLSGAVNTTNTGKAAVLTIDAGSTWEVTGNSYLTGLTNNGTISGTGKVYVNGSEYTP